VYLVVVQDHSQLNGTPGEALDGLISKGKSALAARFRSTENINFDDYKIDLV
jgi:hypothetical protein